MWLKVCGITRRCDAELAAALGAEAIGFVFWPGSRRFVHPEVAAAIAAATPARVQRVGVFVNESPERVEAVSRQVGLDLVQLHGDESPELCARMTAGVIKAIPVGERFSPSSLTALPPRITVLLDAEDREHRGGTGRAVDQVIARGVAARRRTILAGGLTAGTVAAAIRHVRPWGVDVSSGVEASPGIKDPERLQRFVEAVRSVER